MNTTADCTERDRTAIAKQEKPEQKILLSLAVLAAGCIMFAGSAVTAQTSLQQGTPISRIRAELLRDGWTPVRVDKKNADGERLNLEAEAVLLFRAGFYEVEYCTGTGLNYCFFNYQKHGECLRISTEGEYFSAAEEPKFTRSTNECPD